MIKRKWTKGPNDDLQNMTQKTKQINHQSI